jgi:hypothetical protein
MPSELGKLLWPVVACTKREALKLVSSPEAADIIARAVVRSSERFTSSSERVIERERARLVDMALTIIVRERNRLRAPPAIPPSSDPDRSKI